MAGAIRTQGYKRAVLFMGGILVLLAVWLAVAIRREVRQQVLNRASITAIEASHNAFLSD